MKHFGLFSHLYAEKGIIMPANKNALIRYRVIIELCFSALWNLVESSIPRMNIKIATTI